MKKSLCFVICALLCPILAPGCQQSAPAERPVALELTVPDPAWKIEIERVYRKGDRLLVVSRVTRDPEAIAAQVISQASDLVRIPAPDLPLEHYVVGKTWGWSEEDFHFVTESELKKVTEGATLLYRERSGR